MRALAARRGSPPSTARETLVDELLDLHTPRQLVGLGAILERIEADLRAAPVLAALRLALLHAILPASRLASGPGRAASAARLGRPRPAAERRPVARAQPVARLRGRRSGGVRGFVQRLESGAARPGPGPARRGPAEPRGGDRDRGPRPRQRRAGCVLLRDDPTRLRPDGADRRASGWSSASRRCARASTGWPPPTTRRRGSSGARRPASCRSTRWPVPRCAPPWSWQAAAIGRALEAVEPSMARDGRVVQLVDGGPEALVAAVVGGASAGYRLAQRAAVGSRRGRRPASSSCSRPAAACRPGRGRGRTSASTRCPAARATRTSSPARACSPPPERFDRRPFSAADAARTVTETAVETLRARGEPARFERLLGEILVGLDRAGQLRRLASATLAPAGPRPATRDEPDRTTTVRRREPRARRRDGCAGDRATTARRSSAEPRRIRDDRRRPGARERAVAGVPSASRRRRRSRPPRAAPGGRSGRGSDPWSACWRSSATSSAGRPSGA